MKPNRHTVPADLVGDSTFLPGRVVRAADTAMLQVLDEDAKLHKYGIVPPSRSR
jgi:hypothetical protein